MHGCAAELDRFLGSDMEVRRRAIEDEIQRAGRTVSRHPFHTPLAAGINLVAPPSNGNSSTLIVTHYDGQSRHDNAGGVWLALQLMHRPDASALFTDCEECFQQGAAAFLRDYWSDHPPWPVSRVLCIDGFGAGREMCVRLHDQPFHFAGCYFRMDADVFCEAGIKTYTAFTGLDLLESSGAYDENDYVIDDVNFFHWKMCGPMQLAQAWEGLK